MVTTNDPHFAKRLQLFRNHGIDSDARTRLAQGQWYYEMVTLGFNYRLTDISCALGLSQLRRIDFNLARRREIAAQYHDAFKDLPGVRLPYVQAHNDPSWHLYPVRFDQAVLGVTRAEVFAALRAEGVGVNVHYVPVHIHPYYRTAFGYKPGQYPMAEQAYQQLVSLPIFHGMTDVDVNDVTVAVRKVVEHYVGSAGE
jgi:perosamine synthetase